MCVKHVNCLLPPKDQAGLPKPSCTTQHALDGCRGTACVYRGAFKGGSFLLDVDGQNAPLVILPTPREHQGVLVGPGENHAAAIRPPRSLLPFTLKELRQALLDL